MTLPDLKDIQWIIVALLVPIIGALWRLAIRTNQGKERLEQVAENKKSIDALKEEMAGIKGDISDIKESVDKQTQDTSAMLSLLQSITIALNDKDCNIGPARDKFNDYLAKR